MGTATVASVRALFRTLGDYESTTDPTDATIDTFTKRAMHRWWRLIQAVNPRLIRKFITGTSTVASQDYVDLPTTFDTLQGVEGQTGGNWYQIRRVSEVRRYRYQSSASGFPCHYYLVGDGANSLRAHFLPTPDAVYPLRFLAIPPPPTWASDGDTVEVFDGIGEDFITWLAVRLFRHREERETSGADAEISELAGEFKRRFGDETVEPNYLPDAYHGDGDEMYRGF